MTTMPRGLLRVDDLWRLQGGLHTVSGLYMVEDGNSRLPQLDDTDDCRIEQRDGKLIIGGHPFMSDEAGIVARVMRDSRISGKERYHMAHIKGGAGPSQQPRRPVEER